MKKQILSLFAVVAFAAFLFTSCETDDATITLLGDNPIEFDLGEEYEEPGYEVDGGNEDDVVTSFSPEYDKSKVNEYVATYSLGNASATRTVHVTSALLAGSYSVEDNEDGNPDPIYYNIVASQSGTDFNKLNISNFLGYDITAAAVVNGDDVTVAKFQPTGWADGESIEATGSYSGENKELLSFDYTVIEVYNDDVLTTTGTATLTKQK